MCYAMIAPVAQMAMGSLSSIKGSQASAMSNEANAQVAAYKEQDAYNRGGLAEDAQRAKTRQITGDQIAEMGAGGAVVGSGSAGKVLDQTAVMGEMDAQTIRSNAMREAWGYEVEKQNYLAAAEADKQNEKIQSAFLTAGQSLLPKWMSNSLNPGGAAIWSGLGVKSHA